MKPAKTLQDAFDILNPRQSIRPEQVKDLFVSRDYSPVQQERNYY